MALDLDLESLIDARHPPAKQCRVCWALPLLPDPTRDLMSRVLASGAPAQAVADAFVTREFPVSADSVRRHRLRCG